ncbi:MFS transporter [Enterobacter hormaechei]|uniref:MFS transporter n=1 Tax=Enterobacter hormaechei TaxID=158836 RepID=UPI000FFF5C5C|nr:MFS transporter [Enterobacter cloacae]HAV1760814.1 MFS transporter [Enterobacter hormaechei subsp. steigerwaltii]HAV1763133.1 MFS transporter [Enterobacter hormaechei subsp. steigerwaltii]HCR0469717.1 MFS transporter [Enterobacter hormaechei]HCR0472708.1 MFS transporter [Enterobacter hormaechei]
MTQVNDVRDAHVETTPAPTVSPWQPLSQPVFRMLWIATVVSNVGSWMSDVGINWSMLTLSADPLDIALVQAASSLPMFLFALPSGVMADIVDRRKYLLFSQLWVFIAAAGLTLLSFTGHVTPTVLLAATFLLSVGAAMSSPPFQAIVPDLVSKSELGSAVALNSLGVNISRAIGPALGGFLLSLAGPWMVFALNALSVMGVAWVLWRWRPAPSVQRLPPEHFFSAVRSGIRYVHAAPVLRNVLVRTVAFFVFGSAGWALLPLVARRELGLGPAGYGVMLACIGLGAIAGAILLPRLRQRLNADRLMVAASLTFAITMLALAFVRHFWLLNLFEFFTGFAWIAVLSTLNLGAQRSAARWVKARALAVYLTVFFGSMTAGSAVWGQIASQFGTPASLVVATLGMVLASMTVFRWKLEKDPDLNLDLSGQPLDGVEIELPNERGPVLVSHEYIIDPQNAKAFLQAVHELRRVRRRAGAMSWAVYEDIERPGLFIETFLMGSWIEHLRQQERHTMNDLLLQSRVLAFHQGTTSPAIRYLVAPV